MVKKERSLALLFATALFASALLLFWVQPLVAKMLLPYLGGSPAVWNTCMLFFQGMLLLGYAYSHIVPRILSPRRQALLHIGLLALAGLFLPFQVSASAINSLATGANPSLWLLGTLAVMVGLPFFILSTNGPLLQRWFASTSHPDARDPYFLYGASNLGSLLALLSFPLLLEPSLRLTEQSRVWAAAYIVMIVLISLCAFLPGITHEQSESVAEEENAAISEEGIATGEEDAALNGDGVATASPEVVAPEEASLSWRQRLRWVLLAFVPSSLMLGVTTYLSTDLAPVPLLWVVPLALYLLTFVLVFMKTRLLPFRFIARFVMPVGALALCYLFAIGINRPIWLLITFHLFFFFLATLVCHWRLAETRPPARYLTEFYLWIAVGGVMGGIFNALLAPVIFRRVIEYPLVIVLACLLRPPMGKKPDTRLQQVLDIIIPVVLLTTLVGLSRFSSIWENATTWNMIVLPLVITLSLLFLDRPLRFGLIIAAILLGSSFYADRDRTLHVERNFFGVLSVLSDTDDGLHQLHHGNTKHGMQFTDAETRCEPISYYFRTGPIGSVYEAYAARRVSPNVAVVGLGAGTMSAYAQPGEDWTFYEIDPAVVRIAQNQNYFTYLGECAKVPIRFVIGDARLRLREAPEGHYGLIVLDAFSSDAIPMHLMTEEAVRLYLSKLAPGGMIAFHISNRHLNLGPVLGGIAQKNNLTALISDDENKDTLERWKGKDASTWVVIARSPDDVGQLSANLSWRPVEAGQKPLVWTDDFSNIFSVLK